MQEAVTLFKAELAEKTCRLASLQADLRCCCCTILAYRHSACCMAHASILGSIRFISSMLCGRLERQQCSVSARAATFSHLAGRQGCEKQSFR